MPHASRFAVSSLLSLILITPAFAGVSTVSIKPGNPNPEKPSVFVYSVDPGQTIQDTMLVTNDTDDTVLVHLDAVDNAATGDGSFACAQDGETHSFFGTWVTYETEDFELAPREKKMIPFTILVPQDIEVGEHSGCLTSSRGKDPARQVLQNGVALNFRNAIGTFLTVKGEMIQKLSIKDFTTKKLGQGKVHAEMSIQNDGNVFLRAATELQVRDILGREVAVYEQGGIAMRNKDLSYQFVIDELNASPFYSLVAKTNYTLKNGDIVTLEDKVSRVWMMPSLHYSLLYLGILACLLSGLAYLRTKQALEKKIRKTWGMTKIKKSMFIQDLAQEYGVSWTLIAKVNKMSAPYQITEGMELLLPEKETPHEDKGSTKKTSAKKVSPRPKAKKKTDS